MTIDTQPPEHLSDASSAWFIEVVAEYGLEPHHVRLLTLAAESWDRGEEARIALAEHGLTYDDRFGHVSTSAGTSAGCHICVTSTFSLLPPGPLMHGAREHVEPRRREDGCED